MGAGFPAGLVVRIWCFHYGGPGSIPGWGTKILLSCPVQQKKKKLHYSTLRYIIVKLLKTKLKEKYLKAAREKLLLSTGIQRHKGLLIRNNWSCFTSGHGGHTVLISEATALRFPLGESSRAPQPGPAQAMLPECACHSRPGRHHKRRRTAPDRSLAAAHCRSGEMSQPTRGQAQALLSVPASSPNVFFPVIRCRCQNIRSDCI